MQIWQGAGQTGLAVAGGALLFQSLDVGECDACTLAYVLDACVH